MALTKGGSRAKVEARNRSVYEQTVQKGLDELREFEQEFRAAKNKHIADQHQGAYTSEQQVYDAWETQKRIRNEWGSEEGSTGSIIRPILTERAAKTGKMPEEVAESILRGLYSEPKFKETIRQLKAGNRTVLEVFGDSLEAHQRITLGRDAAEMSTEEYLEEILRGSDTYDINDGGNVIDVILINGGSGWTERPKINIRTQTGYNAVIVPRFCVQRIGDDNIGEIPPNTTRIIS